MQWKYGLIPALALAVQVHSQVLFDLAFDRGRMAKSMVRHIWSGQCGPYSVGPNLIKFNAYHANLGPGDFFTTNKNNDLFVSKVFDMNGDLRTTLQKDQFCPADNGGPATFVTPGPSTHPISDCDGVSAGWMDVYTAAMPCNGADFGSLVSGDYSIWVEMNPSQSHETFSPNGSEKDRDNHKVWVTGTYTNATSFAVKTSMNVPSRTLASGKRVYYGVHKLNNTGTGIITINSGADITQTAGGSELGLYAHKVQLTNQSGNQSVIQVASGSKLNIRVFGPEQY